MNHFSPRSSQIKEERYLEKNDKPSKATDPPYILYNIGLSNLKPQDKIRRYWISFRDPVNLANVEGVLREHFPVGLHGYAGVFQIEQVYTCWVELDDYLNWNQVMRLTEAALREVC